MESETRGHTLERVAHAPGRVVTLPRHNTVKLHADESFALADLPPHLATALSCFDEDGAPTPQCASHSPASSALRTSYAARGAFLSRAEGCVHEPVCHPVF